MSNNTIGSTKHTEQAIQNRSFDAEFDIATREIVGYDGSNLQRIKVNTDGSLVTDTKETTDLEGNGIVSVGVTAVEIPFTGTTQSINIESVMGNSGILYIGKSDVTNLGANALTSLQPGASVQMDFNDTTNALFVVSDTAAQSFIAGCLLIKTNPQYLKRNGTVLSPIISGDDFTTTGKGTFGDLTVGLFHTPYTNTITVSHTSGGDYATIQAALNDNATANTLFLVYPGTYTDDTIHFTANNQEIRGMGISPSSVKITTASSNIVDYGDFTRCRINRMKMEVTAGTTLVHTVTGAAGSCNLVK